jgi:hypothetical protein
VVPGDTPAVTKLFHHTRRTGIHPYRACNIEGVPHKTVGVAKQGKNPHAHTHHYYHLGPDTMVFVRSKTNRSRLPQLNIFIEELPCRTHKRYITDGLVAQKDCLGNASLHSAVKGVSPLAHLPTVSFPESFPFRSYLVYCGFG